MQTVSNPCIQPGARRSEAELYPNTSLPPAPGTCRASLDMHHLSWASPHIPGHHGFPSSQGRELGRSSGIPRARRAGAAEGGWGCSSFPFLLGWGPLTHIWDGSCFPGSGSRALVTLLDAAVSGNPSRAGSRQTVQEVGGNSPDGGYHNDSLFHATERS